MVQTCKCTCSQEVLKQHLTCSPEHALLSTSAKKKSTELVCPLGHYEGGSAIIYLGENLELPEAINGITGSCFCLADSYVLLKMNRKVRYHKPYLSFTQTLLH